MREGQRVTYVGPKQGQGLLTGDVGSLLMFASASSAHVQMPSGDVYLIDTADLVATASTSPVQDSLDDSLEFGGIATFGARQIFDLEGSSGVVNAMAQSGHLAAFSEIAEDALVLVSSRIRQDPSFREVAAALDDEEAEEVLRQAAATLIRDAFVDEGE